MTIANDLRALADRLDAAPDVDALAAEIGACRATIGRLERTEASLRKSLVDADDLNRQLRLERDTLSNDNERLRTRLERAERATK